MDMASALNSRTERVSTCQISRAPSVDVVMAKLSSGRPSFLNGEGYRTAMPVHAATAVPAAVHAPTPAPIMAAPQPAPRPAMKIESIETIVVCIPYTTGGSADADAWGGKTWTTADALLVKIATDEGIVGWGEAFGYNVIPATRVA